MVHRIVLMGKTGHKVMEYDPHPTTSSGRRQVLEAERVVTEHLDQGFPVFAIAEDAPAGKLAVFDPTQKEMLLALPLAGG